jgi:hypothetical protein
VLRFHHVTGKDRVNDILILDDGRLLMATGQGLFQLQGVTWTLLFARTNAHGVVLPGGQGVLLAEQVPAGVRLVERHLTPPQTRIGLAVSPGKRVLGEVAASPDGRFGALLAGAGDYVYVYRLDDLSPASAPVRTSHTTNPASRHPAFRPY